MSTLLQMVVPDAPQNLIGDNAYDSDRITADRYVTAVGADEPVLDALEAMKETGGVLTIKSRLDRAAER